MYNKEWFDQQYIDTDVSNLDGWLISLRYSQKKRFQQIISSILSIKKVAYFDKVLDVGSGIDIFGDFLRKRINVKNYIGTDISEQAIDYANSLNKDSCSFICSELPEIPFKNNYFDLILMIEVLYYLNESDRNLAVENAIKSLKIGGLLCISGSLANKDYFTEKTFENFHEEKLTLLITDYHYSRYYYFFEDILMNLIKLEDYINKSLLNENNKNPASLLKKLLNIYLIAILLKPFTYALSLIATKLLASKLLYEIITKVCKFLFKEKNKSGIIKIYKKI